MKKLKVRIAVAVHPETLEWNCSGWGGGGKEPTDDDKMGLAIDLIAAGELRFWLEGEIDIPETQTITATVAEEK